MRTRRPSLFQRSAASRAAASPASSPSAKTITSRTSSWQIESSKPGSRKRRPRRMAGRLHGGEAGLDALSDHQDIAGWGEPHSAAAAGAEHHLLRIDRRLADPSRARKVRWIASGASSTPRVTSATIAGQTLPDGCFSPAWKRSDGLGVS